MNKKALLQKLNSIDILEIIIRAFEKVPREEFVPEKYKPYAYEDIPLPIGHGATISQPWTIAFMLNLLELKKNQKVLEIGSGSGYVLALLSEITHGNIFGVEINTELAARSQKTLRKLGYTKIKIINKSGSHGLPEHAPFDCILISAAAQDAPYHLTGQLKEKGIIVASVQDKVVKITKTNNKLITQEFKGFSFVPLQD